MPLLDDLRSDTGGAYLYDLLEAPDAGESATGAGVSASVSVPTHIAEQGLRLHLAPIPLSGVVQADGWIYAGPPDDTTGPTAPSFTLVAEGSQALRATITEPALDSQTQVGVYVVEVSTLSDVAGFATYRTVARDVAEAAEGFLLTGLTAVPTWVRIFGRDNSPNLNDGDYSDVETATPNAPSTPESWYPNDPVMVVSCQQAAITYGYLGSTQEREYIDETNISIAPWWYPTPDRNALRFEAFGERSNRVGLYVNYNEVWRSVANPGNSANELFKEVADSPTEGHPNWFARRLNGDRVGPVWDRTGMYQMNGCSRVAGRNSRNESIAQRFARMIREKFNSASYPFFDEIFDAIFIDVCQARPPVMYVNATTTASDMDYDQDGVIDARNVYSSASNAGGRKWAEGTLDFRDALQALFPDVEIIPNAARWDEEDGGYPPSPLSDHPFYRQWTTILDELSQMNFGVDTLGGSATSYTKQSYGHMSLFFKKLAINRRFLKPNDSDSRTGRCAVILQAPAIRRGNTTPPAAADINFARFMFALCMLEDRAAYGVTIASQRAMPLDELLLKFGNPVGQRSMGTLNESTRVYALRQANVTVGSATMHYQLYDNILATARTDTPPTGTVLWTGSVDPVTFNLPTPPAGKKFRRFNSATYVNSTTGLATRGQNTSMNSGADATTVTHDYYGAQFFEVVDA